VLSGCRAAGITRRIVHWIVEAGRFWLVCDAHTLLPVVFGLLYVNGPLAASENGSRQTALLDGRACDYDPRAEKAGPTLLTGTSNKDRETMRDIISAGRRGKS